VALVLEVSSQHLDGLPMRREESIVLRREPLGEELVPRGGLLDGGVVQGAHHHDADQDGRKHRREDRAGDQDRLQAQPPEHRVESTAVGSAIWRASAWAIEQPPCQTVGGSSFAGRQVRIFATRRR
jgi:hypothetical protein